MKKTLIFSIACCLTLASCGDEQNNATNPEDEKLFAGIDVRKEFQKKSPVAEEIEIEILDKALETGENVILTASFSRADVKRIEEEFLALQFGKEKVVLRDDGKGADAKKGDGKFSIHLKEDIDQLIKNLAASKKANLSSKNPVFSGARTITSIDLKEIRDFNPDDLKAKKRLRIPIRIFPFPFPTGGTPAAFPIIANKSLMITNTDVVEDLTRTFNPCDMNAATAGAPNGVWTFGELMRQMASPNPGAIANDAATITFIMDWLNTWDVPNTVNGDFVPQRNNITTVINTWQNFSDQANLAAGNPVGPLLLERAPFKLTAIVNRVDLRVNSGYGSGDAGEGRLVYCVMDDLCNPREFNVIFEYGVNKKSCPDIKAYGQEWADLSAPTLVLGSPAFNAQLENITNQFTLCGTNTAKPNENSINQVRTNEIAIGSPWELREFNLTTAGKLEIVDVKMEPARKYNTKAANAQTALLANYVNANEADILANNYEIPLLEAGSDFRGGAAHTGFPPVGVINVPGNSPSHWDGRTAAPHLINNDDARHILSLNTCSGCHGGETQTSFTHIDPAAFGAEAGLSGFLTGTPGRSVAGIAPIDADGLPNNIMTVNDPAGRPTGGPVVSRGFNDLQRRVNDLNVLINQTCFDISAFGIARRLTFRPLVMSH